MIWLRTSLIQLLSLLLIGGCGHFAFSQTSDPDVITNSQTSDSTVLVNQNFLNLSQRISQETSSTQVLNSYFVNGLLLTTHGGTNVDSSAWPTGDVIFMSAPGVWSHEPTSNFTPNWVPNNIQIFTSNGTWTKPAGVSSVYVRIWGGGGGAGNAGAGGSGGGYAEGPILVAGNVAVTIGVGGSSGGGPTAGGDSSFVGSSTITAHGGGAQAGAGGTGAGGSISFTGQVGGQGTNISMGGYAGGPQIAISGATVADPPATVQGVVSLISNLFYGQGAQAINPGVNGRGGLAIVYY